MDKENRRVVITGLGVISSIGIGKDAFWSNLIKGKSGISKIEAFDTSQYERHFGGEVKDFRAEEFIDKRKLKHMGRASQMALAASRLAIDDSGLELKKIDKDRIGVCVGTTMGEGQIIEQINTILVNKDTDSVDAFLVPQYQTSALGINISLELGLKGMVAVFSNACAAGNYSIGYGYDLIKSSKAEYILTGGSDPFSRISFTGFSRLYAMSPEICRPYDLNREGMLVGEGSGMLLLETLDSALKRKATIYAEILGYGLSCDAYHMTAPKEEGMIECMKKAIKEADIKLEDVDYISAHGTGTVQNDKTECSAIKKVFNGRYKEIPISSIKSMLGHTMGAASAIEAISCCLTIKEGVIAPTINYQTPDPECDIDCVPNQARKAGVNIALNNSYAFGGNNACLVLRKYT